MKYIESNVCSVMDTKGVRVGTIGYFADSPYRLKERVVNEERRHLGTLTYIEPGDTSFRFAKEDNTSWALFYPVDNSKATPLTMNIVANLCSDKSITDTYSLLTSCAEKVVEASKRYATWEYNHEHLEEGKAKFTETVIDLVCLCGAIASRENIDLDKALTARLFSDKQEQEEEWQW